MVILKIINGDDITVEDSRYEGIAAAKVDTGVTHLNLGDRIIKKTMIAEVILEAEDTTWKSFVPQVAEPWKNNG